MIYVTITLASTGAGGQEVKFMDHISPSIPEYHCKDFFPLIVYILKQPLKISFFSWLETSSVFGASASKVLNKIKI